jgi:hypothetical protein
MKPAHRSLMGLPQRASAADAILAEQLHHRQIQGHRKMT